MKNRAVGELASVENMNWRVGGSLPCQTLVRRSEVIFDCHCEIWSDGRAVGSKRSVENNRSKFHPIKLPTADPPILL